MAKPHAIIAFGASGSGTTTLGKELARLLGFEFLDADDFYWQSSQIPFTLKRPREERIEMLQEAIGTIDNGRGFVISGSICGWDEAVTPLLDLAVYVATPTQVRIERLKAREYALFGDRILPGGDMHENHAEFLAWAAGYDTAGLEMRSHELHMQWASTLACPLVCVDGTGDVHAMAQKLFEEHYVKPGEPWRVYTADLNALSPYRYVVTFARCQGKWLYARHRDRITWETAGGHVEPGETPYEAAMRELYEETGAIPQKLEEAFDYGVHTDTDFAFGRVFFAQLSDYRIGEIPESEMAEARLFDTLPEDMTYPQLLPVLFEKIQAYLASRIPDELTGI